MRNLVPAAIVLLALSIGGCTSSEAPPPADQPAKPQPLTVTLAPPPPPGATGAPAVGISSLPPVPVAKPADFGDGLVATVTKIEDVAKLEANGPGERVGPGVSVTVDLRNNSKAPVNLGGVEVNASYGKDGTPAESTTSPPFNPLAGDLPPGQNKAGVYVFQVPTDGAASLLVSVAWNGSPNVVLVQR